MLPKVIQSPSAPAVPIEDIVDGMVVNAGQLLEPSVDKVYETALVGLTNNGTAALLGMSRQILMFHFPKTLAKARADKAAEMMQKINNKADDELSKGDMAAIKLILNRCDPEDKEPQVVIQQQINIADKYKLSIDDINDL